MKTSGIITIIILITIGLFAYLTITENESVTYKQFTDYEKVFRAEIDSLKRNQRQLIGNQDTIKRNLDTLKVGQQVIYRHVYEMSIKADKEEKDFVQSIFEILE